MNPWKTMLSVVIFCTVQGNSSAEGFTLSGTPYDIKLEFLKKVMRQDNEWRFIFDQGVFYDFDRTDYKTIIDDELLPGARYDLPASDLPSEDKTADPTGDPVRPYIFLKNMFAKKNHRIGTVVTMGVEILRKSYRCLAYKNLTHLLKLIRVEIGRKNQQRTAANWSRKAKPVVAHILMKMTELLGFSDNTILNASRFLDIYDKHTTQTISNKYNYTPQLDKMTDEMRKYIAKHCVRAPKTDREIAIELKVAKTDDLYDSSTSLTIPDATFKKMFVSCLEKIEEHFGAIPLSMKGMSPDRWDDILHYRWFGDGIEDKDDKDDDFDFVQIVRLK